MSNTINNFKKLQEEEEERLLRSQKPKIQKVQNGIWQSLGVFKFVGQLIEVYLPAMVEVLLFSAGGNDTQRKAPNMGGVDDVPPDVTPTPPDQPISRR
ncbi:MAG TPA: hypothetical protein PKA00_18940 [Saprospiraceae bacterium]|nr:hypothetical protein [Saprospiraceae bacterium]HMQ84995.1 hypothetical protein [Saprospiraceae bacterium]